jgi:hypothetical protein
MSIWRVVARTVPTMKFRLPRKIKKKLKNDLFSYPKSEKNTYLIAWPYKYEKDYIAYKKGILRGLKEKIKNI